MSNTNDSNVLPPHIALFPSAGMGHLTPFLRVASVLLSRHCTVTLITAKPRVSAAESSHISSFLSQNPQVKHVDFQTIPFHHSNPATTDDPFFLQFDSISRSVDLLRPLLSASSLSPPLSAIFADLAVASSIAPVAAELGIPNYVICTSSIKFLCLAAYLPVLVADPARLGSNSTEVNIPGLTPVPISSIPPPFKDPDHLFTSTIVRNAKALSKVSGIIVNSFDWLEQETLAAVNNGRVLNSLPPVLPIGPLRPYKTKNDTGKYLSWLDSQPEESVVYVSFGSRTAMSRDQIRELSKGLEESGSRFLWVLKTSKVDKDDHKDEVKDIVGDSFIERTRNMGVVVKGWVSQEEILQHPAIGGFVNHCGWNSVTEAARRGVPMVAWPQHGDQMLNAEVVEKAGLGIWVKEWGWGAEVLVSGEEIGEKIKRVMEDEKLRVMARKVGEEARKATGLDGSSEKVLMEILELLEQKRN
ncbi:UDP-glucuronosyl/UDP-glucosyltransferase [Trema orientale]|uniref:UDP-glucuronosyl/UDP-glucosyltransferase n=1 Tax=Trema orientale TaxID=63057 RepID=A0A2P5FEY8_TREOI|nr:UDP-glucuronosyl/UDP-glucosyltransferase [Trema orientale]